MYIILQNQFFILLGLLLVVFSIVFIFLQKTRKKMDLLLGGNHEQSPNQYQDLLRRLIRTETKIEEIKPHVELAEALAKASIHKVSFLRFNPFQDTGGDNSFVMALLDWENTGILLSSLYTREGVRLYGKSVKSGQSKHPLSEEEKKVLAEAINKKQKS